MSSPLTMVPPATMVSASTAATVRDVRCPHEQALDALQDKLQSKDRLIKQLRSDIFNVQAKVGSLTITNQNLGHANRRLHLQAGKDLDAKRNLKDTKVDLYLAREEVEKTREEMMQHREGERQARKDVSIALGEVERLNGVARALTKELQSVKSRAEVQETQYWKEEAKVAKDEVERLKGIEVGLGERLAAYETTFGGPDMLPVALDEVKRLRQAVSTFEKLLDTADRDLVEAQSDSERLRMRVATLERDGPVDGTLKTTNQVWQSVHRSEEYSRTAAFGAQYIQHEETFSVCPLTGSLIRETRIMFESNRVGMDKVTCTQIPLVDLDTSQTNAYSV